MKDFKKNNSEEMLKLAQRAVDNWIKQNPKTKNNARDINLIKMSVGNVTLEEMGRKFGITRERVRQVIELRGPKELILYRKFKNHKICNKCKKLSIIVNCKHVLCEECNKKRILEDEKYWSKMYKSMSCSSCKRNDKPHKVRGMCSTCYSRWAYNNLPNRKQSVKKFNYNWRKNNPDRWGIISDRAIKKYRKKLKSNPRIYSAYLKVAREHYKERMNDPKYREKRRGYYRNKHKQSN